MARVTVEDCLQHINNKFDLILIAAKRARQLTLTGTEPLVPWENDKPTVVALREVGKGYLDVVKESIKDYEEIREGKVEKPYHAFASDVHELKDARE